MIRRTQQRLIEFAGGSGGDGAVTRGDQIVEHSELIESAEARFAPRN